MGRCLAGRPASNPFCSPIGFNMAIFERKPDGSLALKSVTCCNQCGSPPPVIAAITPAPEVPDTQPEPAESTDVAAPEDNEEVDDDPSSN